MKEWLIRMVKQYANRETLLYVVFGVLTTAVDFLVYNVCMFWLESFTGIHVANLLATALAWAAAVIFSYLANKWWVFRRRAASRRELFVEMGEFVGTRVVSLLVSEAGMFVFVSLLHLNENLSKIIVSVAVVIINYFFMKRVVFRTPEQPSNEP